MHAMALYSWFVVLLLVLLLKISILNTFQDYHLARCSHHVLFLFYFILNLYAIYINDINVGGLVTGLMIGLCCLNMDSGFIHLSGLKFFVFPLM